jgi:hypothetical protein
VKIAVDMRNTVPHKDCTRSIVTALAGDSKMFEVGQKVKVTGTVLEGVILGRSPKHWWPNLDDCFRVKVEGHGIFNFPESKMESA